LVNNLFNKCKLHVKADTGEDMIIELQNVNNVIGWETFVLSGRDSEHGQRELWIVCKRTFVSDPDSWCINFDAKTVYHIKSYPDSQKKYYKFVKLEII
jgi:hypothetical protein